MKKIAFITVLIMLTFVAEAKRKAKVLVDDFDNPWFNGPVQKVHGDVPPKTFKFASKLDNPKIQIEHDPNKEENLSMEWKFMRVRKLPAKYGTKNAIKQQLTVPTKLEKINKDFGLKGLDSELTKTEKK